MKLPHIFTLLAGALLTLAATGCNDNMANKTKIAVVNVTSIVQAAQLATQEQKHLEVVKTILMKAGEDAEKSYAGMDKAHAARARESDAQILNAQWVAEQRMARSALVDEVVRTAAEIGKREGYALVLDGSAGSVVLVTEDIDVTAAVEKAVSGKKVAFSALPQVSVKDGAASGQK